MSRRVRPSIAAIIMSVGLATALTVALDVALIVGPGDPDAVIALAILMFNGAAILMAVVGSIVERRRPGHRVGRLLLLGGPLYALIAVAWLTADQIEATIGPDGAGVIAVVGAIASYAGVTLIVGGVPLLFPTGSLPGRGWRWPVAALAGLLAVGIAAFATRPGPLHEISIENPFGLPGWPAILQIFIDLIWFDVLGFFLLGVLGLLVRYRRGSSIERLQIRWLAAAGALCLGGFVLTLVELRVRPDAGPVASTLVAYAGILAIPIAIGIAITRYRLYDIDRLISRTLSWTVLTSVLVAVFAGLVVVLQATLADVTQGGTVAVAVSTLLVLSPFRPLHRRTIVRGRGRARGFRGDPARAASGRRPPSGDRKSRRHADRAAGA